MVEGNIASGKTEFIEQFSDIEGIEVLHSLPFRYNILVW